jgi:hypothetical protein
MNIYVVAPLFVFLAILIVVIPLLIIYRIYGPRLEAEYARTHGLIPETNPNPNTNPSGEMKTRIGLETALAAKCQTLFEPNRKPEDVDIEMLTVNGGKSNHSSVAPPQSPQRAQVKPERRQIELIRPARSTSHCTPNSYAATVTDLEDVPDTSAAATAAATTESKRQSEIGRSDTQKTYSSTASTVVSPEMRYESIRTARSGPLPTIKPNKDGFFEAGGGSKKGSGKGSNVAGFGSGSSSGSASSSGSLSGSTSASTSTSPSHPATSTDPHKSDDKDKARTLTEFYQAHRENKESARSPAVKFRDTLKAQQKQKQKNQTDRTSESDMFEDVDLGDDGSRTRDFGRSRK